MTKDELDQLQQEIFDRLERAGFPIEEWKKQFEASHQNDALTEPRPFERMTPSAYGKIRNLKPGFTETTSHPRYPHIEVLRCQAAKKRTHGLVQCRALAIKGRTVCQVHGGARNSGVLTKAGRAYQIAASSTQGGRESLAIRNERKKLNAIDRSLTKQAVALGLRGPTRAKRKPKLNL